MSQALKEGSISNTTFQNYINVDIYNIQVTKSNQNISDHYNNGSESLNAGCMRCPSNW